jgi:hydrogenase maturation protease
LTPPPGVRIREFDGEAIGLLDVWEACAAVVIVDAVRSGAAGGTVHRFDASDAAVPATFRHSSSHTIGVADAIELARGLGRLPSRVLVFGIEGAEFDASTTLSEVVERALAGLRSEVANAAATLATAPPT